MHDILKHVGKARIIVFYYSAHTYVVSLSTKLQKRQTSFKENNKKYRTKIIIAILFPLSPHTFSQYQSLANTNTYLHSILLLLKVIKFYMSCLAYFFWYIIDRYYINILCAVLITFPY